MTQERIELVLLTHTAYASQSTRHSRSDGDFKSRVNSSFFNSSLQPQSASAAIFPLFFAIITAGIWWDAPSVSALIHAIEVLNRTDDWRTER